MNPAHDIYLIALGLALAIALHQTAKWYRRWIWPELRRAEGHVIVVASPDHARDEIARLLMWQKAHEDQRRHNRAKIEEMLRERAGYIAERDALATEVKRLRALYIHEPKQPDITSTTA
jgi:hypothetical protein